MIRSTTVRVCVCVCVCARREPYRSRKSNRQKKKKKKKKKKKMKMKMKKKTERKKKKRKKNNETVSRGKTSTEATEWDTDIRRAAANCHSTSGRFNDARRRPMASSTSTILPLRDRRSISRTALPPPPPPPLLLLLLLLRGLSTAAYRASRRPSTFLFFSFSIPFG